MVIRYTKTFKNQYKKLPTKIQDQFGDRLKLFLVDPTDSRLRIHPLKGKYVGYWSMNISGDFRTLFRRDGEEIIIFGLIGTHSELYG
jgi:addiction module RelE/StbE family toxin